MKRTSLFITALLITLSTIFLPGVSAQSGDAEIELVASRVAANVGDEITVEVKLKNPDAQSIISVRSWLTYDPSVLEGVSIDLTDSPFTLAAPGEDNFSADESRVKIGRSNITGGVTDAEVTVATVKFRVKSANAVTTTISPFDYQVSELGHVNANIIEDGFPVNVLSTEPSAITIDLNGGASSAQVTPQPIATISTPTVANDVDNNTPVSVGGPSFLSSLVRPENVKVSTGNGYADLRWDGPTDVERTGYFLYYGKTSGRYTRRRDVGNQTTYRLEGLNNGETYFFAITAYNRFQQESDYSNEVGIIIGEPLSSTSPFDGLLDAYLARVKEQPESGPALTYWLLFSATGLAGTVMFRRKES